MPLASLAGQRQQATAITALAIMSLSAVAWTVWPAFVKT
jgi:hypothetical protein